MSAVDDLTAAVNNLQAEKDEIVSHIQNLEQQIVDLDGALQNPGTDPVAVQLQVGRINDTVQVLKQATVPPTNTPQPILEPQPLPVPEAQPQAAPEPLTETSPPEEP